MLSIEYGKAFTFTLYELESPDELPVEATMVVTYLQFPIQVCFPCISQPITNSFRIRQPCGFNNSNDKCVTLLFGLQGVGFKVGGDMQAPHIEVVLRPLFVMLVGIILLVLIHFLCGRSRSIMMFLKVFVFYFRY